MYRFLKRLSTVSCASFLCFFLADGYLENERMKGIVVLPAARDESSFGLPAAESADQLSSFPSFS